MKKQIILFAWLALILTGCRRPSTLPTTGEYVSGMESYDRTFIRLIGKWNIPGGALAVIKDGQLLLARGYGLADVERNEPVQPESLFRDEFLVELITSMGRAAAMDKLPWLSLPALVVLAGVGLTVAVLAWKKKHRKGKR